MEDQFHRAQYQAIAALVRQQIKEPPEVGIILGSGLGGVGERVSDPNATMSADALRGRLLRVGKHKFAKLR